MGLADFVSQLLPKRWKDKFDSPDMPDIGLVGSPDRMSGIASSPQEVPNQSGLIMGHGASSGRGYQVIPRDPNETPEQTNRRFEQEAIWQQGRQPFGAMSAAEFRDPTAAQFPVSGTGRSVNDGYGAGYNKSPLDPGYVAPQIKPSLARTDTNVSPATLPRPITALPPALDDDDSIKTERAPYTGAPSALSQMGTPPPEMTWEPLVRDPKSGKPTISPTAQGNGVEIATRERDALERWKPNRKRGIKNTLEGTWEGFRAGGVPGAIFGAIGSTIKPSLAGMPERRRLLDEANVNVDRSQREAENQAQIDSAIIRPQLEQQRIDLAGRKEREGVERDAVQESLKLHAGIPFDPNDPTDANLLTRANKLGIRVPTKYADIKPNLREHNPLIIETKNADGSTTRKMSRDYGVTWETAEGLGDSAPPMKPTDDNATRSSWYYKQQKEQESASIELRKQAAAIKPRVDDRGTYPLDDSQKAEKDDLLQRARAADRNALEFREKGDRATTEAKPTSKASGLTIEGAIAHWKKVNKKLNREPTADEIARMKAAMER